MSILSIYLQQAQLKPQYHPSYSTDPKGEAVRPVSKLRMQRKQRLLEISREIGTAVLADIAKSEPTARLFAQVGSTDGLCSSAPEKGDK